MQSDRAGSPYGLTRPENDRAVPAIGDLRCRCEPKPLISAGACPRAPAAGLRDRDHAVSTAIKSVLNRFLTKLVYDLATLQLEARSARQKGCIRSICHEPP